MRSISLLLILIIAVSVLSSHTVYPAASNNAAPSIRMLDVCNAVTPVLNPEVPFLAASAFAPRPFQAAAAYEPRLIVHHPLIVVCQDDRPPKILI